MIETQTKTQESFTRRVTREHRAAVALLIDASASMQSAITYDGRLLSQGEVAAISANAILKELLCKSKASDEIRDYYDVMILTYNGDGTQSLFGDDKKGYFKSISEIAMMGSGDKIISLEAITPFNSDDEELRNSKFVIAPKGETPMYEALYIALEELTKWCSDTKNRESTPPIVINITDGHTTDSSLEDIVEISERIKNISTKDGDSLLINIFLSDSLETMIFPTPTELNDSPNEFYRAMGHSASKLPKVFEPVAHYMRREDIADHSPNGYHAVGFGVSVEDMIAMMNIGTLVTTK